MLCHSSKENDGDKTLLLMSFVASVTNGDVFYYPGVSERCPVKNVFSQRCTLAKVFPFRSLKVCAFAEQSIEFIVTNKWHQFSIDTIATWCVISSPPGKRLEQKLLVFFCAQEHKLIVRNRHRVFFCAGSEKHERRLVNMQMFCSAVSTPPLSSQVRTDAERYTF